MVKFLNLEVVQQEQSEILEMDYSDNRKKIIENQFFDEDGNFFNSMLISFASGISSVKGSPLDVEKLNIQPNSKNSPYYDLNIRTPIDKKKLFGNLKQTSSSLHRKAQAMNKPMHSNRKLFDGEDELKPKIFQQSSSKVVLIDKENNSENGQKFNQMIHSPILSIKGTWDHKAPPTPVEKLSPADSPNTALYKSPFVLHPKNLNLKSGPQFATPLNGLKGSLVVPST